MMHRAFAAARSWSWCRKEHGQTIIETALTFPILCLMLFGFIDFSLIMFNLCNTTYATHAAARYASVHSLASIAPATNSSVTDFMKPFLPSFPPNTQSISVTYPSTGTNTVGGTVQIQVTLTYTLKLPFYTINNFKVNSTAQAIIVN